MQIENTDDTSLDYLDLPPEVVAKVIKHTTKIRGLLKSASENIIETGLELIDAKESVGHGKFEQWLDSQFGLGERTARKMMAVGRQFKTAQYADLQLAPSALYLLAEPKTPEKVREKFIAKAKTEEVTHKEVKNAIDKTKQAKKKKPAVKKAKKEAPPKKPPPPPENHDDFKAPKNAAKIRGKKLFTSLRHAVGHAHRALYGKQILWGPRSNYHMGEAMDRFIDFKKADLLAEFKEVIKCYRDNIESGKLTDKLNPQNLFKQMDNLMRIVAHEETKRLAESVKGEKQERLFESK